MFYDHSLSRKMKINPNKDSIYQNSRQKKEKEQFICFLLEIVVIFIPDLNMMCSKRSIVISQCASSTICFK